MPGLAIRPRHRPIRFALAALVLLGFAAGELGRIGGPATVTWWADAGWTCCACLAIGGCAQAARRGGPDRRAWLLFTGACVVWLLGQLARDYYEHVAAVVPPFPSWGDAGWLGCTPLFAAGIAALPRFERRKVWAAVFGLDLVIVALALGLIEAVATQDLLVTSTAATDAGKAAAMAYPTAYLTLGFSAFLFVLRVPRLAASPGMWLLMFGLLCEAAGVVSWAQPMLDGTYRDGTSLDLIWMAGLLAIGLAGLEWAEPRERHLVAEERTPALPLVVLELIPTALGTAVALVVPMLAVHQVQGPLEAGARVLIGLIAMRQLGAVLQNVRLYRAEAQQRGLAERRADRLRKLQESSRMLGLDLDPEGIAQVIVDTVCSTLGYRLAVLNLVLNPEAPEGERRIRPVATAGLDPEVATHFLAQDAPASDAFPFCPSGTVSPAPITCRRPRRVPSSPRPTCRTGRRRCSRRRMAGRPATSSSSR